MPSAAIVLGLIVLTPICAWIGYETKKWYVGLGGWLFLNALYIIPGMLGH